MPRRTSYDCADRPVTEVAAGNGHYLFHYRREGDVPCPQSRKEAAAYERLRTGRTLDGWEYSVFKKAEEYDCVIDDGSAQHTHAAIHRKNGERAGLALTRKTGMTGCGNQVRKTEYTGRRPLGIRFTFCFGKTDVGMSV